MKKPLSLFIIPFPKKKVKHIAYKPTTKPSTAVEVDFYSVAAVTPLFSENEF